MIAAVFVAALLCVFAFSQAAVWDANGIWHDELYTLYATDPGRPVGSALAMMMSDTHPPTFYLSVWLARLVHDGDPRLLFLAVNSLFALAMLPLLLDRRPVGYAVLAFAAFLASGAASQFLQEGRNNFMAGCITFVIALAAFDAAARTREVRLDGLAALGFLASVIHLFAALAAGSIAAGLRFLGYVSGRSELLAPSFGLGMGAVIGTAAWLAWAYQFADRVSWIKFSPATILPNLGLTTRLTVGGNLTLALVVLAIIAALAVPRLRPVVLVFAIAGALVVLLPLLVSFKKPIFIARYLTVVSPVLPAFLVVAARIGFTAKGTAGVTAAILAGLALIFTGVDAGQRAASYTADQNVYRSAPDVAAAAASCPARSVRVLVAGTVEDEQDVLYAIASGLPVEKFTPVGPNIAQAAPWPGPDCPVVAWVEHGPELPAGDPADPAVAAALLARVGITADPTEFRIERHRAGFVVYRRQ